MCVKLILQLGRSFPHYPKQNTITIAPQPEWRAFQEENTLKGAFGVTSAVYGPDMQHPPVIPGEDRCLEALKAKPQEMFGGSNTDPHKAFGCLGMILYIYLSLKFVVFGSAQEESAQEEKDLREKLARCVNYQKFYFSSGAFGGGNMRKAKTTSGDLGCTGEANGEQYSIKHHELHSTVTFVTVFCYHPCMVYLPTFLFKIYDEYVFKIDIP